MRSLRGLRCDDFCQGGVAASCSGDAGPGERWSTTGCAKVGAAEGDEGIQGRQSGLPAQDYKRAAGLYEESDSVGDPKPAASAYFFLANSYDNLYKPSKKGEATTTPC